MWKTYGGCDLVGVGKDSLFGSVSHGRGWGCRGVGEIEVNRFSRPSGTGSYFARPTQPWKRWAIIIGPSGTRTRIRRPRTQIRPRRKTHIHPRPRTQIRPRTLEPTSIPDLELRFVQDLEPRSSPDLELGFVQDLELISVWDLELTSGQSPNWRDGGGRAGEVCGERDRRPGPQPGWRLPPVGEHSVTSGA
jgi:hypothetical protein